MNRTIRIGTRGSKLALWQAHWVAERLRAAHADISVSIEIIKTVGDRVQDRPVEQIGVEGAFTRELDQALIDGRVEVAVHSLKDLPTTPADGIELAAIPEREDPRDVFIGKAARCIGDLPQGAVVGISSLRRRAQLLALRPDVKTAELRGNVDTRLRKLRDSSTLGGIMLALAGVRRLGLENAVTEVLELDRWLPAPGQGALAVTVRIDDADAQRLVSELDDAGTRAAVTAERALLARLEGGCHVPVGAYARLDDGILVLDGLIAALDGSRVVRSSVRGTPARGRHLGEELAEVLLSEGGAELLATFEARR